MPDNILNFDELKLYFGKPVKINDYITLHSPTVGEIVEYGEQEYYSMIYTITAIPSDLKSRLFDIGIDWEEISDFHLFYLLTRNLTVDDTRIILGSLNLAEMILVKNPENNQELLYNETTGEKLDELAYMKIVGGLRKIHSIVPKVEKALNKTTKKILIDLDRERISKLKDKPYESQLKPLISAMMRYPGFKYKSCELEQCTLYEFMDTVLGAQIYVDSVALLQGSYSGMIDTSKINKKLFNWLRDTAKK